MLKEGNAVFFKCYPSPSKIMLSDASGQVLKLGAFKRTCPHGLSVNPLSI